MQPYQDHGPVTCDDSFSTDHVKGKTAVITGGANGMGAAYVRSLVQAGAFVVFGDLDDASGKKLESELGNQAQYVTCDVAQWKDQLDMFKQAIANSPNHRVDIVIANAGISGYDDVFHGNPENEEPEEPQLKIVKINGIGVLYTTKLTLHYFRRQHQQDLEASKDQLLILQGSLAGYLDLRGSAQYGFCKWGMRGLMRNLRRTEHEHGCRVNYIAPWFVKTGILSDATIERLEAAGFEFATVDDAALAAMKMCADPSINGRTFAITPRTTFEFGYTDIAAEEYEKDPLKYWQELSLGAKHREMSKEDQATKAHAG